MIQKNDIVQIKITAMSSDGNGIGRFDNMAVFVPQSAIGDVLQVRIVKKNKTFCYGKKENIIKSSENRINDNCDVFSKCGGCVYRHINYNHEAEIKQNVVESNLQRIGGFENFKVEKIIVGDSIENYRNKAQFPVRVAEDGEIKIGFYAPRSHRVIGCVECNLQPKEFQGIVEIVKKYIVDNHVPIYDEKNHTGLIRHIYIRKAVATDEFMVTIVATNNQLPHQIDIVNSLKDYLGDKLKSVQININKIKTNVILGDTCRTIYGNSYITDVLCGIKVRISPLSFYQVNHDVTEMLYKKAEEYCNPEGKVILDLYCGTGTIGLFMAKKAKKIIGVEIVPQAIEDAKTNAKINNILNARFICADATQAAQQLTKEKIRPDVVVVDPPRKGCTEQLLTTIVNEFCPKKIVYISCDSATLARDCKFLSQNGYSLKHATPIDLFPRTAHIETVCLLSRI